MSSTLQSLHQPHPSYDLENTPILDDGKPNGYPSIHDPRTEESEDTPILKIKNLFQIEVSLLLNVFLAAFDGKITASTYTIIGSEFNAVKSWFTTSYLVTSTSFQPLNGSFSDVFGRRVCYLFATSIFALGRAGCSMSATVFQLFLARSLTGIGGGGLINLAIVVNSDIIPFSKRGLFQGLQNILVGIGSIIKDIDIEGSLLLVAGLTFQLLALSNASYILTILSLIILIVVIKILKYQLPPFKQIHGATNYLILFISVLTEFANFANIFILPLLFRIILKDSPSKVGVGSSITAYFMNRNVENLLYLVHCGIFLLWVGNVLALFTSPKIPDQLL